MASQFYIVHHHFKPGMAGSWWGVMAEADETAQAAMAEKWLNMGYFNHCFMPLSQEGPMYCVWEVKDVLKVINLELTGGVPPYERKFA